MIYTRRITLVIPFEKDIQTLETQLLTSLVDKINQSTKKIYVGYVWENYERMAKCYSITGPDLPKIYECRPGCNSIEINVSTLENIVRCVLNENG